MGGQCAMSRGDDSPSGRRPSRPVVAAPDQVRAGRVGLRFPERMLAFEHWRELGVLIARTADSTAWSMGDWLAYGESRYAGRYRRAVEDVGLSYQTLRNYAWVARRFPLSRRRDGLTFQHHMEVARLATGEQDQWLDRAIENRWSVRVLRQRLKEADGPARDPVAALPRISADPLSLTRWQAAARNSDKSFEQWVVASLDRAATQELENENPIVLDSR